MKQEDDRLQLAILRLKRPAGEAVCRFNTGLEPKRACCAGAARLQRKDFLHGRCSIQSAVHSVATCSHQGQRSFLITARELWGISDVEGWYCPKCRHCSGVAPAQMAAYKPWSHVKRKESMP